VLEEPVKECDPPLVEPDPSAEPLQYRTPRQSADAVPQVVTENCSSRSRGDHSHQAQPPGGRSVYRRQHQHRLAREGQTGAFHQRRGKDGGVAVDVEQMVRVEIERHVS
jgi:hypothetical protein